MTRMSRETILHLINSHVKAQLLVFKAGIHCIELLNDAAYGA